MKIKLIDKSVPLPRCWKSCGASYEDWQELQNGKEIEVVKINYPISKTTFVRIDKRKDGLQITKNVTQLFKRNDVVDLLLNIIFSPFYR